MSDLEASITEYEAQLLAVTTAAAADPGNEQLSELQQQLQQLIDLTKESLLEQKKKQLLEQVSLFEDSDESPENSAQQACEDLSKNLAQLEGVKVSAPHENMLDGVDYHNAIIFSVEVESESASDLDDVMVRVVYSHPTSQSMVPCQYYLSGRCRFSDSDCKWSHGQVLCLSSLKEWVEPDYGEVKVDGAVLMLEEEQNVWRRAMVEAVEGDNIYVKFDKIKAETVCVKMEKVLPLSGGTKADEEDFCDNDRSLGCGNDDGGDDDNFAPTVLVASGEGGKMGEWEMYTKGVGSRLMACMGWVVGSGLGAKGEGRLDPVPAMVYPQGKSLDWCMDLRERAGGEDMLSMEKKMKRKAKIEEKKSMKKYEADLKRDQNEKSLFNFINNKLGGHRGNIKDIVKIGGCENPKKETKNNFIKCKGQLKKETCQTLNVQNFRLHEEIGRKEKELSKLRESHARHKLKDPKTAEGIKHKILEKELDLQKLISYEKNLTAEKGARQNNKKLSIF